MVGHVYTARRDYAKAQEAYQEVSRNHPQAFRIVVDALTALAGLDAIEGRWEDAQGRYREIAERFPWTAAGFQAPVQIAMLRERSGSAPQAAQAWQDAAKWYETHLASAPAPELEVPLKGYLATVYQKAQRWEEAVKVLEELGRLDNPGINRPKILYDLALLYSSRLKQPEREAALLGEIAQTYPADPFGRAARARLNQLADVGVEEKP